MIVIGPYEPFANAKLTVFIDYWFILYIILINLAQVFII